MRPVSLDHDRPANQGCDFRLELGQILDGHERLPFNGLVVVGLDVQTWDFGAGQRPNVRLVVLQSQDRDGVGHGGSGIRGQLRSVRRPRLALIAFRPGALASGQT